MARLGHVYPRILSKRAISIKKKPRLTLLSYPAPIGKQVNTIWDTEQLLTAVGNESQILWTNKTNVSQVIETIWNIYTSLGLTNSVLWGINTTVGASAEALWATK